MSKKSEKYVNYKYYIENRTHHDKEKIKSYEFIDNSLVKLSIGAFGLSVIFLVNIGEPNSILSLILIISIWFILLGSITCFFWSYGYAIKTHNEFIDKLDWEYKYQKTKKDSKEERYIGITDRYNKWAIRLFFSACVLFLIYASIIQINKYNQKQNKKEASIEQKKQ